MTTEITTLLAEGEADLLSAAKAGWAVVEGALTALEPQVKADLAALLQELEVDLEGGKSVDELVTALLNLAEAKAMPLVIQVGTDVLNGLVASLLAGL